MPHFETQRHVAHSAAEMFALGADVERYPEFVPLCERLVIRARQHEGDREILVADMTVGYKAIRETFTTRVALDRPALTIAAQYLEGPFRHLDNRWTFRPEGPRACSVEFSISYEFRSRMLALIMGAAFDTMFRRFADAFQARADAVYGLAGGVALGRTGDRRRLSAKSGTHEIRRRLLGPRFRGGDSQAHAPAAQDARQIRLRSISSAWRTEAMRIPERPISPNRSSA